MNLFNRTMLAAAIFGAASMPASAANLLKNGSFENPVVPDGSYALYSTGETFGGWTVVGATGNVAPISGTFQQNGFTFPAKKGSQWLDLTGTSNSATGVQRPVKTQPHATYSLSFYIGNVYDPNGIFGTSSTVDVVIDGQQVASFTNKSGNGSTAQVWRKFSTEFVATKFNTQIALINGDPSGDSHNGLDAVSVILVAGP
jgi:hypothetical protein